MEARERERIILLGGIGLVGAFIVLFLVVHTVGKASDLESSINAHKRALKETQELGAEYLALKQREEVLQKRLTTGGQPLLTYLETLCRNSQINSPALSPKRTGSSEYYEESSVELRVAGLTLEQLLNLLRAIESSPRYIRIKTLKIETPYAHKELLDATLQVSSYSPKTPGETPPAPEETP